MALWQRALETRYNTGEERPLHPDGSDMSIRDINTARKTTVRRKAEEV